MLNQKENFVQRGEVNPKTENKTKHFALKGHCDQRYRKRERRNILPSTESGKKNPCRKKRNQDQKDYFDSQEEENPKSNATFRHAEIRQSEKKKKILMWEEINPKTMEHFDVQEEENPKTMEHFDIQEKRRIQKP